MDPYEIVGVPRSASKSEIESAYRKRARELHPDKNGSTSEFQNLHNAFELIKNAESLEQFMCRDDPISKRIGCDFKGIVEINRIVTDTEVITEKWMFYPDNTVTKEVIDRVSL